MHSSKSNNQQMILYCYFSSDSVISPLVRGLDRAMSRTLPGVPVVAYLVFFVVLVPIIAVFVILSVLRDIGIIGRSYEDISWLSGVRNMYNR